MLYDQILQLEREITMLVQSAARTSLLGSTLGVRTNEDGMFEIYSVWHDESARELYDSIQALIEQRSVDLARLKAQVK